MNHDSKDIAQQKRKQTPSSSTSTNINNTTVPILANPINTNASTTTATTSATSKVHATENYELEGTAQVATKKSLASRSTTCVRTGPGTDNLHAASKKSDKCVCTQENYEDLQRALTYEAVFSSLLENKMLAMKRDCEERKRLKRVKRKSIGRIFFSKKLFSSRKTLSRRLEGAAGKDLDQTTTNVAQATAKKAVARSHTVDEIEVVASPVSTDSQRSISLRSTLNRSNWLRTAATTAATSAAEVKPVQTSATNADDSIASSTMSNSSGKQGVRRSLLVRAQTHTPAAGTTITSSSSTDSKEFPMARPSTNTTGNGNGNGSGPPVSLLEQRTTYDTTSLASGYDNGTGARVHSSTMAEDSLTSLRDSFESLSFPSSRCTVSFGGTEIIPEDTASLLCERVIAAKRLRILEAKSISAQCSPIFPRHAIQVTPAPQVAIAPMQTINIVPKPTTVVVDKLAPLVGTRTSVLTTARLPPSMHGSLRTSATQTTRARYLPNQLSYTDSTYNCVADFEGSTNYSRNISRQNTSEDSANVTLSTLLNQSDSLSLQAPAYFASTSAMVATNVFTSPVRSLMSVDHRYKSKSASLLLAHEQGRSRPPPMPAVVLPTEQLENVSSTSQTIRHIDSLDTTSIPECTSQPAILTNFYPALSSTTKTSKSEVSEVKRAFTVSNVQPEPANLHRMTSTSTGSSVAPTGCCTTTKSTTREREKQRFQSTVFPTGQSGSDDEYRKRKRKYSTY